MELTLKTIKVVCTDNTGIRNYNIATIVGRVFDGCFEDTDLVIPATHIALDELGFSKKNT